MLYTTYELNKYLAPSSASPCSKNVIVEKIGKYSKFAGVKYVFVKQGKTLRMVVG
jgi:hypothetical protein